ncbi:PilN domain-containing protein [Angustibacter luteus]|uniref:PilN domain-containing protein n=1 Tax=Angustibacter luteus TaxID=658456 RepID=A0ABW1JAM2_9ACTN
MSLLDQTQTQGLGTTSTAGLRLARVNLLPPEIEEARTLRRVQAGLGAGLAVVAVVAAGAYFVQVQDKHHAADELAVTKAETVRLQAEQAKYQDVPRTIAAIDAAATARSTAMANDVLWYRTMNNFAVTIPSNTWMTSLTLALGNSAPTPAATAATGAGTAAAGATPATVLGTVSVNGTALDHPNVATWLDSLGRQPGLSDAYFTSSTRAKIGTTPVVNFVSTASITDAALSHRYDRNGE